MLEMLSKPRIVSRVENIKIIKKIKFLGILIDDRLNFTEHVNSTHQKISRETGAIRRIRPCIDDWLIYCGMGKFKEHGINKVGDIRMHTNILSVLNF